MNDTPMIRIKGEARGAPHLKYCHRIRVTFRGRFPVDMLRYDRCSPATEASSGEIEASLYDDMKRRTVLLTKQASQTWSTDPGVWTARRWASYSCKIECVTPWETETD